MPTEAFASQVRKLHTDGGERSPGGISAFSSVREIIIAAILQHNNGQESNVSAFALLFVVFIREHGGVCYKSVLYQKEIDIKSF